MDYTFVDKYLETLQGEINQHLNNINYDIDKLKRDKETSLKKIENKKIINNIVLITLSASLLLSLFIFSSTPILSWLVPTLLAVISLPYGIINGLSIQKEKEDTLNSNLLSLRSLFAKKTDLENIRKFVIGDPLTIEEIHSSIKTILLTERDNEYLKKLSFGVISHLPDDGMKDQDYYLTEMLGYKSPKLPTQSLPNKMDRVPKCSFEYSNPKVYKRIKRK